MVTTSEICDYNVVSEALQGQVDLPKKEVEPEIERLIIKPGESLVVTLASRGIPPSQIAMLDQRIRALLPGVEFVIVSDLVRFTVIDTVAAKELVATNGLDLDGDRL